MSPSPRAPKRSRAVAGRRAGAAILGLACAAAGVAACGQSAQLHRPVTIVPAVAAKGQSYDWDATCPFAPRAADGCAPPYA